MSSEKHERILRDVLQCCENQKVEVEVVEMMSRFFQSNYLLKGTICLEMVVGLADF